MLALNHLVFCVCPGSRYIYSACSGLASSTGCCLTSLSAFLVSFNSSVDSAVLLTIFYVVLAASNPVLVAVSVNSFKYFSDRLPEIDESPDPLTYFLVLCSLEYLIFIY